ncbi:hypothetical protein HanRHA438_Chr05g0242951 [Helianthus annuus]|nr:hypothetical protein HanRHA438_Chr05g0242951 [Helianthus annuus]
MVVLYAFVSRSESYFEDLRLLSLSMCSIISLGVLTCEPVSEPQARVLVLNVFCLFIGKRFEFYRESLMCPQLYH